jgi:hypothetical protein
MSAGRLVEDTVVIAPAVVPAAVVPAAVVAVASADRVEAVVDAAAAGG